MDDNAANVVIDQSRQQPYPNPIMASATHPTTTRWQKPQQGRLKCNIDATFNSTSNRIGVDICVRDDEGAYVLAKTFSFTSMTPVDVGETLRLFYVI